MAEDMRQVRKDVNSATNGFAMRVFGALVVVINYEQDLDAKNTMPRYREFELYALGIHV